MAAQPEPGTQSDRGVELDPPAWAGRLPDGRTYTTCPSAGICRHVCYAPNGTYLWPAVHGRHHANLAYVLDDLVGRPGSLC